MIDDARLPLKLKFIEYFRKLPVQKLAGAHIGKHEDTITDWKKEDADFSDQLEEAKAQWALEKVAKVKSDEWLLERIMKDHFAQRAELTGKDGKDLSFRWEDGNNNTVPPNASPTETTPVQE